MADTIKSPTLCANRKIRCDKGLTCLNNENKRQSVMSSYNTYKKSERLLQTGEMEITTDFLKQKWNNEIKNNPEELRKYEILSAEHKERGRTLLCDIAALLQQTNEACYEWAGACEKGMDPC